MAQSEYRVSVPHILAGWAGAAFLHLVGRTSAIQKLDHPSYLAIRRESRPCIYALWHNHQVFLAWAHRGEKCSIMVSRSKDGEYIAQVMGRLGLIAVRGSSSRGAESAFRQMIAALERKEQVGFTPDGPRGPAGTVQGGVISAAQMTGYPVVPVAVASRRKIVFRSWDRFFLPLPFSHIVVGHGRPLFVSPEETAEAAGARIKEAIDSAVDAVDTAERLAPPWWTSFWGAFFGLVYAWLGTVLAPLSLLVFLSKHGPARTFRNLGERLNPDGIRPSEGPRLWLHAASVGEWQALRPILAGLRQDETFSFVITVSSPEARVLVSAEEPGLPVRMIPLDLVPVVRRWIDKIRPTAVIIAETELWPNLIACLHRGNIPIFIVNGRLSARSASRWRFFRPMAWRILSPISHFFVRTDLDGQRYCSIGAPVSAVTVTGNTKVDNLTLLSNAARAERRRRFFGDTDGVFLLGGSTWEGEEAALAKLAGIGDGYRLRVVIAPRSKARFESVATHLSGINVSWSRWSDVKAKREWDTDVLLVDTLGDLKDLYGACDFAFVGGSLNPRGGQNPLEPAAAGLPVLFGPSMTNFHEEAEDLKKAGAARQCRHDADLAEDVVELTRDENLRALMGEAAEKYVASRQGAARRTTSAVRAALLVESSRA